MKEFTFRTKNILKATNERFNSPVIAEKNS